MGQTCTVQKHFDKQVQISDLNAHAFDDVYISGKQLAPKVFDVRHRPTGSTRVVYRLRKDLLVCQDGDELSKRVRALTALRHPSVCKLVEAFDSDQYTRLVYEKVVGKPVFEELSAKTYVTESQIASLMLQLLRGLEASAAKGVVHGALCPKNIFLNKEGTIRVTDLGLAGFLKSLPCRDWTDKEDLQCVAPEVARSWLSRQPKSAFEKDTWAALVGETITSAADVWSCGVLLCMMLTGQPPVHAKRGVEELVTGIAECKLDFGTNLSAEANQLLKSMLRKDPARRPTYQELLQHSWFQLDSQVTHAFVPKNVCEELGSYHHETYFKKLMMRVVASKLQPRKIKKLRECFISMDRNGDGQISLEEFQAGLAQHPDLGGEFEQAFREIDYHSTGYISLDEFVAATLDTQRKLVETTLYDAFNAVDANKDGMLSLEELRKVISSLDGSMGQEHGELLLHLLEEEVTGPLTFAQFKAMLLQEGNVKESVKLLKSEGLTICARMQRRCRQVIDLRQEHGIVDEADSLAAQNQVRHGSNDKHASRRDSTFSKTSRRISAFSADNKNTDAEVDTLKGSLLDTTASEASTLAPTEQASTLGLGQSAASELETIDTQTSNLLAPDKTTSDRKPSEIEEPNALAKRKSRLSNAKFASNAIRVDAPGKKSDPVGKSRRTSRLDHGKFVSPKGHLDAAKFGSGSGMKVVKGSIKKKATVPG
eukprot:TRINITY_DN44441_c0_g1_i1.p1 TRINITY_DN44441_c0_g1~~TRINITY_DN44441_c0_g1_i1.p1  ORF type:complete len:710 (-),score=127.38 TRINITY_DN44441_c0_g1_i1:214-2343(-)